MTQLEIIIALEDENKRLRNALADAVDLVRNSKTGVIGPFCQASADKWQQVLDIPPFELNEARLR